MKKARCAHWLSFKTTSNFNLLNRLWGHINTRRRIQFFLLLLLMFAASVAELFTIGSIIPFIGVLTSPEKVFNHSFAQPLISLLNLKSANELFIPFTALFCLAALLAAGIRLTLMWSSTQLTAAIGADLSLEVFRRTLYQPYSIHISRNSSEIISAVSSKSQAVVSSAINPSIQILSSSLTLIIVVSALVSYQPEIALIIITLLAGTYIVISTIIKKQLRNNSVISAENSTRRVKALNEGLGGIRDLIIDGTQSTYCTIFQDADQKLRKAQAQNAVISSSPRYLMEAIGMVMIAILALWLALQPGGLSNALPLVAALALTAQRLLPLMQQFYQNWVNFNGNNRSILEVLDLLDQPFPKHLGKPSISAIPFTQNISLRSVGFKYRDDLPHILKDINLNIPKGSRVGIIGTTGSGKSTLVDIIMGLLQPSQGSMLVDNKVINNDNEKGWQKHIAHVPQSIFLADTSIAQNIAFGIPIEKIDMARVERAATHAQLTDTINSWPDRFQTLVGERGVKLSGGQRQRIGLARALYKAADVIVLDEATSALDNETEQAVMTAIDGLDRNITLLIIAHRLSTLRNCDFIIKVSDGKTEIMHFNNLTLA